MYVREIVRTPRYWYYLERHVLFRNNFAHIHVCTHLGGTLYSWLPIQVNIEWDTRIRE
jgi:hypothetical protein